MKVKDRILFLKYALPCAGTLVKRGKVSQEHIDKIIEQISNNQVPKEEVEKKFKVAFAMCSNLAKEMKKDSINEEVIRRYFISEHDKTVDERFKLMGDFDPVACKTRIGKVLEVDKEFAVVETSLGKKKYKTVFTKDIKKEDNVIVHFDFVVEKVVK
jgi:hypothetical protein